MKYFLCAFALCCVFAFDAKADEIVIVPTAGQLSWFNFPGPGADVATMFVSGPGFFLQASNQEAFGMEWRGLCQIDCTGSTSFNGFATGSFNWSAGTNGVTASGRFNLFPPGSIPTPPGSDPPTPVFTLVFSARGTVVIDTPDRFLFVISDPTAVPEPATILLLTSGVAGLAGARLKKRFRQRS